MSPGEAARLPRLLAFSDGEDALSRLLSYGVPEGEARCLAGRLREHLLYLPPGTLAEAALSGLPSCVPFARVPGGGAFLSAGREEGASGSVPFLADAVRRRHRRPASVPCASGRSLPLGPRPSVMAVLNVTPDSFSDGGRWTDPEGAAEHGLRMLEEGADLVDLGGESTRPGSLPVSPEVQLERVLPVLREILRRAPAALVSVDTTSSRVAEACLREGAALVNDTSALADDPLMSGVVRESGAAVVLMHRRGTPADMQRAPSYRCFMKEMVEEVEERLRAALRAGIPEDGILLDPGIGFGKRPADNLEAHRYLGDLCALGRPVVFASSRKAFLAPFEAGPASGRLHGSAASALIGALHGASVVRVHDPAPARTAMGLLAAVRTGTPP